MQRLICHNHKRGKMLSAPSHAVQSERGDLAHADPPPLRGEEKKFESNWPRHGSVKKAEAPEEEEGPPGSSGFIYVPGSWGGGSSFHLNDGSNQENKQQSHVELVPPSGLQALETRSARTHRLNAKQAAG